MVDLNAMALFVTVVRAGGFSAAARTLDLPKSRISRQITALEQRLGVRLLRRSTRALSLTEAYFRYCGAVVEAAEAADAEALAMAGAPAGLLRITATVDLGRTVLAGALCAYLQEYPRVRIDLNLTDDRVNLVREGFDLAVRMGELADSELTARRLGGFRKVVCASPAYLARRGTPQRPADLQRHDCLVLGHGLAGWHFREGGGAEGDGSEGKGRRDGENGDGKGPGGGVGGDDGEGVGGGGAPAASWQPPGGRGIAFEKMGLRGMRKRD